MKKCFLTLLLLSVLVAPVLADDTTFTSPAGGETWVRGSLHTITYVFSKESPMYEVCLFRNGAFVGYVSFHTYSGYNGVMNEQWEVGKVKDESEVVSWAPCGSGYTLCVGCYGSGPPPHGVSMAFTIRCFDYSFLVKITKIYYFRLPKPGDCPQCLILDLKDLREELIKLKEPVMAGLYWRNSQVAKLGRIGNGQGWPGRLQVKLEADALTAMGRGAEFELRLFSDRHQQVYSQKILLAAGR